MDERIIRLNGHETRLLSRGESGPALLCLHGFPEHAGGWRPLIAEMEGYRCFAPDQRGYGISYRPPAVEDYQAPKLAQDMLDLIGVLGLDRVHLVGHDWGASVAYAVAFQNDPRVASLTVLNGVHPVPFQRELAKGGAQSEASQYMNWLRLPDSHEKLVANNFERLLAFLKKGMDVSWLSDEVLKAYLRIWDGTERMNAMVNWYRASPMKIADPGRPLAPGDLPVFDHDRLQVRVPHMLIWGMRDNALLPGVRDGLGDFCASLEVHEFTDADHWVVHQKPAEIAGLLRDFVARCEG